jgi:DNA-binding response OmpR family regulator
MSTSGSKTSEPVNSLERLSPDQQKVAAIAGQKHVLFVDDEPTLRLTVPLILTNAGFDVLAAGTVPAALSLINTQAFDVLISDLNIGEAGDGFTVVSAMRRCQPRCHTLILTGYPDFDAAMESIRKQADGFIVKPVHPTRLIDTVRQQFEQSRRERELRRRSDRLASLLRTKKQFVIQNWLHSVEKDSLLEQVEMSENERIDHIPLLLDELINVLESKIHVVGHDSDALGGDIHVVHLDELQEQTIQRAAQHGSLRKRQGYSLEMVFRESRLAQAAIFQVLQAHLLELELSCVIPDLTITSDVLEALVAKSVETFSETKAA